MVNTPLEALHQVHTATNDVLTGYDTMLERSEPKITGIITELANLHRDHAATLQARLSELGHTGQDDRSFRGTMNSVAVTLRDWISGLDDGSLDAVERGEKALLDVYDDALQGWSTREDETTASILDQQYQEIDGEISRLLAL